MSELKPTVAEYEAAQARFQRELLELLTRHNLALGGPRHVITALVEVLGMLCVDLLKLAPQLRPEIFQLLTDMGTYIWTSDKTPQ